MLPFESVRLRLDVPLELPPDAVELVLVVGTTPKPNGRKYDFADGVGKVRLMTFGPSGPYCRRDFDATLLTCR